MGMRFEGISPAIRLLMLEEVAYDRERDTVFLSPRLSPKGCLDYPTLLMEAIRDRDEVWLAQQLNSQGRLKTHETSHRNGVPYTKAVPSNAAQLIAEGEYNRFYMRGLCLFAIKTGIPVLEVYRAKITGNPRPESEARIGVHLSPEEVLRDLRENVGDKTTILGVPGGPNSGISLRIAITP